MNSKKAFFLRCYELGIIKFGKFTLKSGIESPFYVDLRPLASDPKILKELANHLLELLPKKDFDLICGVPYAALPMATAMSLQSEIPLIIKRKEAKSYGTKKLLEGIYTSGQSCLLVEDVITSGKSLLETIPEIEKENIKISDIVVVLDREQNGRQLLQQQGYRVHTLFTISEACEMLLEEGKISETEMLRIKDFIAGNQVTFEKKTRLSYDEKRTHAAHPKAKVLLEIAQSKKSNLIASADVTTTAELLDLADKVGPHIVALKTHIDILKDFEFEKTIIPLIELAARHNFLLMEDRKFADIGNTQELQYREGIYKISQWADLVTSHVIAGSESLKAFDRAGVVAIISMSSAGALTDEIYVEKALEAAKMPNVIGAVSQKSIPAEMLLFTPGVNFATASDGKGQQYNTPETVFEELHTDFMIVGRGIYSSENPSAAALKYREAGWNAYEKSLK